MEQIVVISDREHQQRLDHALMGFFPDESRSIIQMWIKNGLVTCGGSSSLKPSHIVRLGEQYIVKAMEPVAALPKATPMSLDILYEDEHILVLNKPVGLVVHPGAGHYEDTLVNGLLHHCKDLSGIGGVLRPGIVHRLDKDTSGIMVVAKHDRAHQNLAQQFQEKANLDGFLRQYIGFTWGVPTPPNGQIMTNIGRDPHHRQR
ncbi:MAG: RluA family pseudouridine synthase, partial [Alphaproteobacteria bacterium]|nr:RluA family pseudouridine synthase [Alphaproteobacteria bacterium]